MAKNEKFSIASGTLISERYRIIKGIGRGGMGQVYAVNDEKTERQCALKVFSADFLVDPDLKKRFDTECRATGNINSDHVVRVLDHGGVPNEYAYIVMEFLNGETLESYINRHEHGLSADETLKYIQQIALGLTKIHEAGVIHRDLKPSNVMLVERDDGSYYAKLIDFGIAKVLGRAHSPEETQGLLGTLQYMAPEEMSIKNVKVGYHVDLYALGHIAYTLLAGECYWSSGVPSKYKIVMGAKLRASEMAKRRGLLTIPNEFDPWFDKAVATNPHNRFESATAQSDALEAALTQATTHHTDQKTSNNGTPPPNTTLVDNKGGTFEIPDLESNSRYKDKNISADPPQDQRKTRPMHALILLGLVVALALLFHERIFSTDVPADVATGNRSTGSTGHSDNTDTGKSAASASKPKSTTDPPGSQGLGASGGRANEKKPRDSSTKVSKETESSVAPDASQASANNGTGDQPNASQPAEVSIPGISAEDLKITYKKHLEDLRVKRLRAIAEPLKIR